MTFKFHPVADIFPLMPDPELASLAEDIKANGLREAIWLHPDGSILDGRNRYLACQKACVEPETREWGGEEGSEVAFVLSLNLHRRHLNESQRAMVAGRVATLGHGGDRRSDQAANLPVVTQSESAVALSVSERSVRSARLVLDNATPEVVAQVDAGNMPVSFGAKLADAPEEVQRAVAAKVSEGTKPTEAMRQYKKETLGDKVAELPKGKYRVIYADPPWQYNDSRGGLEDYSATAAEHHYPTMPTDEICSLPVKDRAADDSVLFCWATFPLLEDALRVVKSWGFKFKTAFVWSKLRPNKGNYHRADAELLLVATRGSCTPDADKLPAQVQTIERTGKHSEKPEKFRGLIDSLYVKGPRVELFRRGDAPDGWKVWGNESR